LTGHLPKVDGNDACWILERGLECSGVECPGSPSRRKGIMLKVLCLLLGLFACLEITNFTGSWAQLRWLSDQELVKAAVLYNYRGAYSSLAELKIYYSSFEPAVYYWTDLTGEAGSQFWNKFFGLKLFQVRLPDAVVMVTSDGEARFSRACSENRWCSPEIPPDRPVLGVVGTVQDGPPAYDIATKFSVRWADGSGDVFVSGHCFAAFSSSKKPALEISAPFNRGIIKIDGFGYRLVAIKDVRSASSYASLKISETDFRQSQTCDDAVRVGWPNVGGVNWKR
jgi:hypothetical protein